MGSRFKNNDIMCTRAIDSQGWLLERLSLPLWKQGISHAQERMSLKENTQTVSVQPYLHTQPRTLLLKVCETISTHQAILQGHQLGILEFISSNTAWKSCQIPQVKGLVLHNCTYFWCQFQVQATTNMFCLGILLLFCFSARAWTQDLVHVNQAFCGWVTPQPQLSVLLTDWLQSQQFTPPNSINLQLIY